MSEGSESLCKMIDVIVAFGMAIDDKILN